ncbi:1-aminocyclopropane-1-carboxylate deaminase/D-cysteine desulfhydrase [Rheinheimera maricola]|uniref:Pyridoxal-phosphate dependent enzyme n=1 Tax=Rheinheimera maricola TaxID=2793282 RepID=A0ABS7XE14_9GAMM|nr:pyridoxal-phosphate dependent enzyme [Rheinheimera maricola]MBZ9613818.1 pyridoxal-phosphate dependent enzyme [Rheinheimera maricola]
MLSSTNSTLTISGRWQKIRHPLLLQHQQELWVFHLDTTLPQLSGNKWLKLKYHIILAQKMQKSGIATFGGAFSNHLAAVAAMCKHHNMQSLAFLRADNLDLDNPTLALCKQQGMDFTLLDRQQYRQRAEVEFIQHIQQQYPSMLLVPEGGSSIEGVRGVTELDLLNTPAGPANVIISPSASGGTVAGIINATKDVTRVLAIAVVKDDSLKQRITSLLHHNHNHNWQLITGYCGAGYARFDEPLLQFCRQMAKQQLYLEPIYSGKALAALFSLIAAGQIPRRARLSFFHTGGLQGLAGLHYRGLITAADYALLSGLEAY